VIRFRDVPGLMLACAVGITVAHFMFTIVSCTPAAPAQAMTAASYEDALQACNAQAVALDGGRPFADKCMCSVAEKYGRYDSGILNCVDGGAK
jgi:hypothetical protein